MSKPWHLLVKPHHLAARFFWSLGASGPPDAGDEQWAEAHLLPAEVELWRRQSNEDRRHCVKVARRFVELRPGATRAEIAGALLHDIGKIECGLGTWGRVAASLVGGRTERFRIYQEHERIGAELCAASGSDPDTVALIAEEHPAYATLRLCDRA